MRCDKSIGISILVVFYSALALSHSLLSVLLSPYHNIGVCVKFERDVFIMICPRVDNSLASEDLNSYDSFCLGSSSLLYYPFP